MILKRHYLTDTLKREAEESKRMYDVKVRFEERRKELERKKRESDPVSEE